MINNFELEPETIIILSLTYNEIVGIICLYDNKFLIEKLNKNNIPLEYYSLNNLHGCFIYNLCVHKFYRNNKIGHNLLKYCIKKMNKLNIEYLHSHVTNEISKSLFLKNGFKNEKVLNNINIMSKYL